MGFYIIRRWTIGQPFTSNIYMINILWHSYIIIICIFGCKRKGWRMSLYFIRIKPKWTIGQPLSFEIYMIKYFMTLTFLLNFYFWFLKGGCPMSFYIIWTIRQPFNIYICMTNIDLCSNEFWLYLCIIYLKFSPSFGRGAGLCRRCGLRGCIGGFGVSVK